VQWPAFARGRMTGYAGDRRHETGRAPLEPPVCHGQRNLGIDRAVLCTGTPTDAILFSLV
jgi:hypothetical protein